MYRMTNRRKLAIASWSSPREGNIYGKLTIDATEAERYLEHLRRTTGEKVTVTHLVGRAAGEALKKAPGVNGRLVLGRYVPHSTVDISFLVALEEGANLGKAKVSHADEKSVAQIAHELHELAERLRRDEDPDFKKSQGPIRLLPTWLLRPLVWLTGLLSGSFGLRVKALGLEPFPFGACIVTSVGMFGLEEGYAPPTPFARVPVYLLVGAMRDAPAVVDGKLTVRRQLTVTATVDHRFIDGAQAGVLAKTLRSVLENPWQLDGARPGPSVRAVGE